MHVPDTENGILESVLASVFTEHCGFLGSPVLALYLGHSPARQLPRASLGVWLLKLIQLAAGQVGDRNSSEFRVCC